MFHVRGDPTTRLFTNCTGMYGSAEQDPQQDFESGQTGGNDEQNEYSSGDEGDIKFDGTVERLRKRIVSSRKH